MFTMEFYMSFLKRILFIAACIMSYTVAQVPDYSTTPRNEVPEEFKWKTEHIFADNEAWYKDKEEAVRLADKVEVLAKDWTTSPQKMLGVFRLSDEINQKFGKLYSYAGHKANVELSNPEYQKMRGEIQSAGVAVSVRFSFINDDILKMPEETVRQYLKDEPGLAPYKFTIEQILRSREHILPLEQEQIISQTALFANANQNASNLLNNVDIPNPEVTLADGSRVTLNYANYSLHRGGKVPEDRTLVMKTFFNNHKKFENSLAALLDGEMKKHVFYAKVRKHPDALSAKLYNDNIDTSVYINLVKMVKENLEPLHRYLKVKQQLLGLDKFRYEDMYASAVKSVDKQYSYEEAKNIIINSLQRLGKGYSSPLQMAFTDGWIDVYPNKDKQSGAYSGAVYGVHPFIKMNYNGEYNAVSTLTHELGHAMHSHLSYETQPYSDAQYPIFLAEVASTFNEHLLMDYMLKNETDDMFKLYILDSYIDGIRATVYRQTLFAEFELAMHRRAEEGKSLTPDWLNETYLNLVREYYAHDEGLTYVDEYIQNEWSNIPHFYMNYYVFQYSTGMIASLALSEKVINGTAEDTERYLTFLKSGGNDYPINILKKAGVDMTQEDAYNAGFRRFGDYITEMEKLTEKLKKENKI
jgi:oligoendopeptidase F